MDASLQHLIIERLAPAGLGEDAVDLILAAFEGAGALAATLAGEGTARTIENVQPELEIQPPGAYVASIAVEGFRGIGPAAKLELTPGPGLTLIVGRNGSGKSSFAEGLELLMTGENKRWHQRTAVWKQGWQNLHHGGDTVLRAQLHVDGEPGLTSLTRTWPAGSAVGPATCDARRADGSAVSLEELGWPDALSRYRPFLSYNELGSMFDELKTMYEALSAILGLEDLEELQKSLRDARLVRERSVKGTLAEAKALAARLEAVDDDRVRGVVTALGTKPIDFDAIELALEGAGDEGDPAGELAALRSLCSLPVPDREAIDDALALLGEARTGLEGLEGTDTARAASLARLLETALRHDEVHTGEDCPVCGSEGVIDEAWRAQTTREIGRLTTEARDAEQARRAVVSAERRVADLLGPAPPAQVAAARELELDPAPLEDAWERWAAARPRVGDPEAIPELEATLAGVVNAAGVLAAAAEAELDRREDVWRPVAKVLRDWLPGARLALAGSDRLPSLKEAERWVREAATDLQAERLAPIAGAAKANWDQLRQQSNVSLEGFHLRRSGNVRAAEVDVRVDGSDASAFGVMSQGELHALAVSVFLPRAGLASSPFRFMVIDDPVQSMDPAKVDGLARVLERAAGTRQVVVFTHDERLPEAVRRLAIPATVLEVTRRPQSIVDVRTALDPVERYLDDARALVRSEDVPRTAIDRVVPGFCRGALEAAATAAVRRRRLGRGEQHAEVEAVLARPTTLYMHLALALFDDETKGSQVLAKVNAKYGNGAGNAVVAANKGVHEVLDVDLRDLIRDTATFARSLAESA